MENNLKMKHSCLQLSCDTKTIDITGLVEMIGEPGDLTIWDPHVIRIVSSLKCAGPTESFEAVNGTWVFVWGWIINPVFKYIHKNYPLKSKTNEIERFWHMEVGDMVITRIRFSCRKSRSVNVRDVNNQPSAKKQKTRFIWKSGFLWPCAAAHAVLRGYWRKPKCPNGV